MSKALVAKSAPRQQRRLPADRLPKASTRLAPEGVVTAIVGVTGVVDHVDDLIVPGAFRRSLTVRRPKVVFHHEWKAFAGRVLHVEELLPGDRRLPAQTKDGQPWPREAGALVATMQFNLNAMGGREAYEWARFYSETNECEWSIGYKVVPEKVAKRAKDGVRLIYDLDVFELSLVLFGAASLSMTLDVKSADGEGGEHVERASHPLAGTFLGQAALSLFEAKALNHMEGKAAEKAIGNGVMVALYPDAQTAAQLAVPDGSPADELHVTLGYLGHDNELAVPEDRLVQAVEDAVGEMVPLSGQLGGLGRFPAGPDGVPVYVPVDVPGLEVLRQKVVDSLAANGAPVNGQHGYTPHLTLGYDVDATDVPPTPVDFDTVWVVIGQSKTPVKIGATGATATPPPDTSSPDEPAPPATEPMEGKGFPKTQKCAKCKEQATKRVLWAEGMAYQPTCDKHEQAVIQSVGGPDEVAGIRPVEKKAAHAALYAARRLSDGVEAKYDTSPVGTPGGRQNWVDEVGGLPPYIRAIAHALIREGRSESQAIQLAVGAVKRWAAGGDDVTAKTRAKAAAALAEWEAKKAAAHASPTGTETKNMVMANMAGSYEELRDQLRDAVNQLMRKPDPDHDGDDDGMLASPGVCIEATYPTHVVASRWEDGKEQSWLVPYTVSDDGISLGAPQEVTLSVVAQVDGEEAAEAPDADDAAAARFADPASSMLRDVALLVTGGLEGKALHKLTNPLLDLLDALAVKGMDVGALVDPADEEDDGDGVDSEDPAEDDDYEEKSGDWGDLPGVDGEDDPDDDGDAEGDTDDDGDGAPPADDGDGTDTEDDDSQVEVDSDDVRAQLDRIRPKG